MIRLLQDPDELLPFSETEPYGAALCAADGEALLPNPELLNVWVEEKDKKITAALLCDEKALVLLTGGAMPSAELLLFVEKLLECGMSTVYCEPLTATVLKNLHPFSETREELLAAEIPAEISCPAGFTLKENPPTGELFEVFSSVLSTAERNEKELWELKIKRGIAKGRATAFALYDGEKPVACAFIRSRLGSYGVIASVVTKEEYRRRGAATYLTSLCQNRLLSEGKRPVLIPADENARRLYEKLGFRPIKEQITLNIKEETP